MGRRQTWDATLQLHDAAAAEFARTAAAIPGQHWSTPRAEGKWSAAQITDHVVKVYGVLLDELAGGPGMAIRTTGWQRLLLRLTLVPRLLAGAPFPEGARAPRETRPAEMPEEKDATLARFHEHARRFHAAAEEARARGTPRRLTHAYFGRSSLKDGVLLCARHLQHHQRQLADLVGQSGAAG